MSGIDISEEAVERADGLRPLTLLDRLEFFGHDNSVWHAPLLLEAWRALTAAEGERDDAFARGRREGAQAMRAVCSDKADLIANHLWDLKSDVAWKVTELASILSTLPLPDAPPREASVAEAAISDLMRKHGTFMQSKGRNPGDYTSQFSLAADALRALIEKDTR